MNTTELLVFKTTAAQRQLDAAIRMYFAGEDELAIYTVAAAAHRILRDLMETRGRSAVSELLHDGVQGLAEALAKGTLSDQDRRLFEGQPIWQVIVRLADSIRDGGSSARLDVVTNSHFDRTFWHSQNEPANFLKHADRDAEHAISVNKIRVEPLLDSACIAYMHLMAGLTIEMDIYAISRQIALTDSTLPEDLECMRRTLARLPTGKRNRVCIRLIRELKKRSKPRPTLRSS